MLDELTQGRERLDQEREGIEQCFQELETREIAVLALGTTVFKRDLEY